MITRRIINLAKWKISFIHCAEHKAERFIASNIPPEINKVNLIAGSILFKENHERD